MKHKTLLSVICLAVLCVPILWASSTLPVFEPPDFSSIEALTVVRVIDGDTIVVSEKPGNLINVRLIGIDTPETVHPSKPVEAYGKEASSFTRNLLKGEKVYLLGDPQQGDTDRYGRKLAYVYRAPDGLFVNAEIIRQGYGHAYTQYPCKHMDAFKQLEKFARDAEKGLWDTAENITEKVNTPATKPKDDTPARTVQPKDTDVTVYVTRTGKKYHLGNCSYLRKSKIPMKLSEAKKSYGPCSRCRPPR